MISKYQCCQDCGKTFILTPASMQYYTHHPQEPIYCPRCGKRNIASITFSQYIADIKTRTDYCPTCAKDGVYDTEV